MSEGNRDPSDYDLGDKGSGFHGGFFIPTEDVPPTLIEKAMAEWTRKHPGESRAEKRRELRRLRKNDSSSA